MHQKKKELFLKPFYTDHFLFLLAPVFIVLVYFHFSSSAIISSAFKAFFIFNPQNQCR